MKKKSNILTTLQVQIETDITVRFIDLSHQNIGKLSLPELRECCTLLSQLGCLYAIDLSHNSLYKLKSHQHDVLLVALMKLPHLHRINLSYNKLLQTSELKTHAYTTLLSKRTNTAFLKAKSPKPESPDPKPESSSPITLLNLSNTDFSTSLTELEYEYYLNKNKQKKYSPLRIKNLFHGLNVSNLSDLDISNTQLHQVAATIAAWQALCNGLSTLKKLRHIDLSANKLNTVPTDQRQLLWLSLNSCLKIEYLTLRDNGFDDDEVLALAPLFDQHLYFIGVALNQEFMDFTENAQALFTLYKILRHLLNSGETAQASIIVNNIIQLRGKDPEIKEIDGCLTELNIKLNTTTTDLLNPISLGLFSTRTQRNRYEHFYNTYCLNKQKPNNLYTKIDHLYKKSLSMSDNKLNAFCLQFQRSFEALTDNLSLAAEGMFTKNAAWKLKAMEYERSESGMHLLHHLADKLKDKREHIKTAATWLPLVGTIISHGTEYFVMSHEQSLARVFMNFIQTKYGGYKLGKVLAYQLCFQLQDHIKTLSSANHFNDIQEEARQRAHDMVELIILEVTPIHKDQKHLGAHLCRKHIANRRLSLKVLSAEELDQFVEQQTKRMTQ